MLSLELTGEMDFLTYSDELITSRINGFFMYYGTYLQNVYGIPAEQYPTCCSLFHKSI